MTIPRRIEIRQDSAGSPRSQGRFFTGESVSHVAITGMKRAIAAAAHQAGEGHIPSALSILDLIWVLYDQVMDFAAPNDQSVASDRFVLSKGHGSLALYAVLAEKGFFPRDELAHFCTYDGRLGGHPDCNKVPGVEASTGSLGHGLPMALGMALGLRIQGSPRRVFCLIGDGEANEGTIWESALLASQHWLGNLRCIVDFNHSTDRALDLGDLSQKFQSFGWDTATIDGHDHQQIRIALNRPDSGRPLAIVAQTVKGKGVPVMESNPAWHHRSPTAPELEQMLESLQ